MKVINELHNNLEQAAREIYYAMTFLNPSNPARANLNLALKCLQVSGPEDVGLSKSILTRNHNYQEKI